MKKFLLLLPLLLLSCSQSNKPGVIQEAADITSGYVDTLEESKSDALKVAEQMNERNQQVEQQINESTR